MIYELPDGYFVRALYASDLAGPYPHWFEDQEVCKYNSHGKFAKNSDWFRSYYESANREDRVVWAICHRDQGHVGNISLQELSFVNRNAEFAILIGDGRHRGKSVGTNAGLILLRHGFQKLNLERIYCGTAATNIGMQKLASQLGMAEEGRRRNHLFLEGEFVDMLEYGLLREEFLVRDANV
jgi:[ribosomal protein S5]-alanine N-acetyltransferase